MSFETEAHGMSRARPKTGKCASELGFVGRRLMEGSSLWFRLAKGNLRVANRIASLRIPAVAGRLLW